MKTKETFKSWGIEKTKQKESRESLYSIYKYSIVSI
jgi:hypothetical protein